MIERDASVRFHFVAIQSPRGSALATRLAVDVARRRDHRLVRLGDGRKANDPNSPTASDGIPPGNQVCTGLAAGGSGIRTAGPSRKTSRSLRRNGKCRRGEKGCLESVVYHAGDRGFESRFLQRRVTNEPAAAHDIGGQRPGNLVERSRQAALDVRRPLPIDQ